MSNGKKRAVMVIPSLVVGNGKITQMDRIIRSRDTQKGYARLLRKMGSDPQHVAEVLRSSTWKGKTLADILAELD